MKIYWGEKNCETSLIFFSKEKRKEKLFCFLPNVKPSGKKLFFLLMNTNKQKCPVKLIIIIIIIIIIKLIKPLSCWIKIYKIFLVCPKCAQHNPFSFIFLFFLIDNFAFFFYI